MGLFFTMSFSRLQANLGEPAKRVCLFFCTEQNSEHITLQNCIKECCQTPRKMTVETVICVLNDYSAFL